MTTMEFRRVYAVNGVTRARCAAKNVYASWQEAEHAALVLTEDLRDGKLKLQKLGAVTAYQCDVCTLWHIGHCRRPSNPWNDWRRAMTAFQARQTWQIHRGHS